MMSFEAFKIWFDQQFFALLEEKSNEFVSYSNHIRVKEITTYLSVFAQGGKRLRPYLAYVGYSTEGGEHDVFMLFAAIELLHLFCLVHDDIMDNAITRHGAETIHTKFDLSIAILAGDLLLAWAFECIHTLEELEPYTVDDCVQEFSVLLREVIHGQMLDVLATKESVTKVAVEKVMELKTAHYSFYRPLALGMLLAGADSEAIDFAEAFGTNLGMAFQLIDDLDDWQEDKKRGQQSLVVWYQSSKPEASQQEIRQYIQGQIAEYLERSQEAVYTYNKDSDQVWEEIIEHFGILKA